MIDPVLMIDAPGLRWRKRRARDPEETQDVRLKRLLELFVVEIVEPLLVLLECGVVHQHVQSPELSHGVFDNLIAKLPIDQIAGKQQRRLTDRFDCGLRLFSVGLLGRQIGERDVGAFPREQQRDRAPDAGIAAGDQCHQPLELACG